MRGREMKEVRTKRERRWERSGSEVKTRQRYGESGRREDASAKDDVKGGQGGRRGGMDERTENRRWGS